MSAQRPKCPRCSGILVPELTFNDRLVSVGCINCGERIYRDHQRRALGKADINAHLQAGRPAHLVPGGKRL